MKVLKWIGLAVAGLLAVVLFLDTFGGKLFDGPLGPIPGGAFVGPVNPAPNPDWTQIPDVIELEIRPSEPWSLSVWGVEHEGELYVPHASGAMRRWVPVALEDPRVRVRTGGQIYERTIVRSEDPAVRQPVLQKLAAKYGFDQSGEDDGTVWLFRLAPR